MKRSFIFLTIAAVLSFISCENEFRDEITELHNEIDDLKTEQEKINSNIEALETIIKAIQNNDFVSGILPIYEGTTEIGYKITFTQSGTVTIFHGKTGADGAQGADGMDGDSFFNDVIVTEYEVIFIKADGEEFVVPRSQRARLNLDITDKETGVIPGKEIVIGYTLENADEKTRVTASSDGVYSVRVEAEGYDRGRIFVTAPYVYSDGFVNIMVSDGESYSFIKVVNFYEEKMIFPEGLEYYVSPKGGEIIIPFRYNFEHEFKVSGAAADWIRTDPQGTKAEMKDGTLVVNVTANTHEYARTGKIQVVPTNSAGEMYTEIVINQASAFFSVEQSKYAVHVDGETITTHISSSRGLTAKIPAEAAGWLSYEITDLGNDNYSFTTAISRNESLSVRSAIVQFYSADGSKALGTIEYVQSSSVQDDLKTMVLVVRANISNDFAPRFTIRNADCYIDWGDGQAERCQADAYSQIEISHTYDITVPTSYTVKIYGNMTDFESAASCISEVVQWGQTGLERISFSGDTALKKICGDEYGSFKNLNYICFENCRNLLSIPENLFAECKNETEFYHTFDGCSSLTEIPENLFAGCKNVTSFYHTFSGCSSLTEIPENLFAECKNVTSFYHTFDGCSSLTEIPENLFAECKNVTSFGGTFSGCSSLNEIPENLFAECKNVTDFRSTFIYCLSLTEIPVSIFDNNRKVKSFVSTFESCISVKGESPYTIIDGVKYHLYERYLNPDQFVTPTSYDDCFSSNFSDIDEIRKHGWY